jgi:hypothetical protein
MALALWLGAGRAAAQPRSAEGAQPTPAAMSLRTRANAASTRVLLALTQARAAGRSQAARCLDDQLAQLDSIVRTVQRATADLPAAQLEQRIGELLASARACTSTRPAADHTVVVVTIDPPPPAAEPRWPE